MDNQLPETILQFGSGKFLRAFADLFVHQANVAGQQIGRIVAVQSTGDDRAQLLMRHEGRYHVRVRGQCGGAAVDEVLESTAIQRALAASRQWPEVLDLARSPDLRYVVSNTAEEGYRIDAADQPGDGPPRSFPAKLVQVLHTRFTAGASGLEFLPCELFEQNADLLRGIVRRLAETWSLSRDFLAWLESECVWRNTLVDRIVCNPAPDDPLLRHDRLLAVTEPFAFWAVERQPGWPEWIRHPAVLETSDVRPFFLRKVRILNAAHTALVAKALPRGISTVREAVSDDQVGDWVRRLLFEEIVPTLEGRVADPASFAAMVQERFLNPYLEHQLADIAAYHASKVQIRLVPTSDEFLEKFGRRPKLIEEAIAARLPQ
jgi:tagaturonate reductase